MRPYSLALTLALLLAPSPISAQITEQEYAERRAHLVSQIAEPAILAVGGARDQNLTYLTGLREPDAVLLIVREDGRITETLFLPAPDPTQDPLEDAGDPAPGPRRVAAEETERATWTRHTQAGSGLSRRDLAELEQVLRPLLAGHPSVATVGAYNPGLRANEPSRRIEAVLAEEADVEVNDASHVITAMRAIKSEAELALIERAVNITAEAHREIMRNLRPGLTEDDIKTVIDGVYSRLGADPRPAFGHIVASGSNSVVLHYRGGDRLMEDGDHVKIDIGAAFQGYAADITRTYPVNGTFSPAQRDIYEIVLEALVAAEQAGTPGASHETLAAAADRALSKGLTRIGLMDGPDASYDCLDRIGEMAECPQLRLFFFHGLGHGIGLAVHDSRPGTLEVGSAYTIEPGIYVRPNLMDLIPDTPRNQEYVRRMGPAFQRYSGIGVRIEDDYFVTLRGVERISRTPRELDEIETFMAAYRDPEQVRN